MAEINLAPLLETGLTSVVAVYTRLSDGAFWNTSGTPAYEAYNAANIANYAVSATEIGATGIYQATNPSATTPGMVLFVTKAGASLAVTDLVSNLRWEENCGPRDATLSTAERQSIHTVDMTGQPTDFTPWGQLQELDFEVESLLTSMAQLTSSDTYNLFLIFNTLRLSLRKDAAIANDFADTLAMINANTGTGTGTYANTSDSQEALRDNLASQTSVDALTGQTFEVSSPVLSAAEIDIVQGMDYYTADGRDLEFSFTRPYTPASCKLTIASGNRITITSTDITESSGSGSGRFSVRFQIPRTDGDDLDAGTGTFEVVSVLSGGRQLAEIAEGKATIRRRLTA